MNELKPCPFCGGEAASNTMRTSDSKIIKMNGQDTFHGVNCIACGANNRGMLGYKTKEQAIQAWNTRHEATQDSYCNCKIGVCEGKEAKRCVFRHCEATQDNWVSVEDRLPKADRNILLLSSDESVSTGYMSLEYGFFFPDAANFTGYVTHWQRIQLPKSNNGESDE